MIGRKIKKLLKYKLLNFNLKDLPLSLLSIPIIFLLLASVPAYGGIVEDNVVLGKIIDSPVYAVVLHDTYSYSDPDLIEVSYPFYSGEKVEVLEDVLYQVYKIKTPTPGDERIGYVPIDTIRIYDDVPRAAEPFTKEELERAVELKMLYSNSPYLLWCDIARQNLYIFLFENEKWNLIREIPCATGRNISPTKRGFFLIYDKMEWFYSEEYDSCAYNALMYDGPYYIHSVPVDWEGNVLEPQLGEKVSAGCIRVSIPESQWLYDYIPVGTGLWVN